MAAVLAAIKAAVKGGIGKLSRTRKTLAPRHQRRGHRQGPGWRARGVLAELTTGYTDDDRPPDAPTVFTDPRQAPPPPRAL